MCEVTYFYRINVLITFMDTVFAKEMEWRWREGTTFDGGQTVRSFFNVINAEKCKEYIDIRQNETDLRLGKGDGGNETDI